MPLKTLKRPAAAASASTVSRPKKQKQADDPVAVKSRAVKEALKASEFPEAVKHMLGSMLEHSLSVHQDTRHKFQNDAVNMVQEVLAEVETNTQKQVDKISTEIDGLNGTEKERRTTAAAEATEAVAAVVSKLTEDKERLATDALAFKAAKASVTTAGADVQESEQALKDKQAEKEALQTANTDILQPLVAGAENAKELVNQLLAALKKEGFSQSLLISIPNAFLKDVGNRGPFDTMVVQQVNEEVTKRLSELTSALNAAEAQKQQRAMAGENCTMQFDAAREKQLSSATQYKATQEKKKELEVTLKAANASLRAVKSEANKLTQELAELQITLQDFRAGPLVAFKELQERTTPPPAPEEPPPAAEEEAENAASDTAADAAADVHGQEAAVDSVAVSE